MRGDDRQQLGMFSYVSLEQRVPKTHPLRGIRKLVDAALQQVDGLLGSMYPPTGRASVAPEKLLRALLLQVLYSVRSERQLIEQLDYNLLFRWFVGLEMDDPVWDHSTFSKNRQRLIDADAARALLLAVVEAARAQQLVSEEHFSVDGTLLQAWASQKSFRPKDEPPGPAAGGDFHGQRRTNETHASTTDPEARLYRKGQGQEARLAYLGHALLENRHALVVDALVNQATGTAEREAALTLLDRVPGEHWITLGADKGYDCAAFVAELDKARVHPHIAQNTTHRRSAVPTAVAATAGYVLSQAARRWVEQPFGWGKRIGPLRQVKLRGTAKVDWLFKLTMTAYNLVRLRPLLVT